MATLDPAIRERHRPVWGAARDVYPILSGPMTTICNDCRQPWGEAGCDTAQVLAALDAAEKVLVEAMALAQRLTESLMPDAIYNAIPRDAAMFDAGEHAARSYAKHISENLRAALTDTGSATDEPPRWDDLETDPAIGGPLL